MKYLSVVFGFLAIMTMSAAAMPGAMPDSLVGRADTIDDPRGGGDRGGRGGDRGGRGGDRGGRGGDRGGDRGGRGGDRGGRGGDRGGRGGDRGGRGGDRGDCHDWDFRHNICHDVVDVNAVDATT
ncbi:hypothetical protein AX14_006956 [Amanita brunnescens Koide BX004]|nr:hypothetical protein AX14_006956 [Amanita brunnescens Koide BX004]